MRSEAVWDNPQPRVLSHGCEPHNSTMHAYARDAGAVFHADICRHPGPPRATLPVAAAQEPDAAAGAGHGQGQARSQGLGVQGL